MRIRQWMAAAVLGVAALTARAQDVQIPYAAPRPANTLVMLPDGSTVHVELAVTEAERNYGLMGRTKLPEGRGMLFLEPEEKQQPYWMYHCKIGLDIVWMDAQHHIVEISPNTPPCRGKSNTCPNYGGHEMSQYVLELPVGDIARHHLKVGETVNFQTE
ncbi:MAG TPA: DUF192 domain-containing protein [Acidobacteriaceae bacterium]|nr:DUF192 domain-containing protein [Acidobacteriaceae bacterium]